jgi:hypothetical protein
MPLSQPALLRIIVGGTVMMVLLLASAIALVFFQVQAVWDSMLTVTPTVTETLPATQTPIVTDTVAPSATATLIPDTATPLPSATDTYAPPPTMLPTLTPFPTASFTPAPPPPTMAPTLPPAATSTPRPPATRQPTYTRRPTNTRPPTSTRAPTRTFTPTRSPTPIRYEVALTASSTAATHSPGQTSSFVATLRNAGSGADTIKVTLVGAVMEGWSAKMYIDGADRGSGPVSLPLAQNATKAITVQIVSSANASAGDVGEAYLSAVSSKSAAAIASLSFSVTIKE